MQIESLIGILSGHSWIPDSIVPTLSKHYPTSVGPKVALIYVQETPEQFQLSADYQSEGRNILSTCWATIPCNTSSQDAETAVADFLSQVEREIGDSYASRLLRRAG